jgi:hypothetical protein
MEWNRVGANSHEFATSISMIFRKNRIYGVTLLELMVASTLLLVFFGGLFILFRQGSRALIALDRKGGVQADFLTLKVSIRADFQRTDLGSVTIESSTPAGRDLVSCLILSNWSDSDNFSVGEGGPKWDRRVAYLFDSAEPSTLNRVVIAPGPEFLHPRPLEDLIKVFSENIVKTVKLSSDVQRFQASVDSSTQQVKFDVALQKGESAGVTGQFVFVPRNTKTRL